MIICSDGFHGVLQDHELEQAVRDRSAEEACKHLVDVANQRGTADNLTAVVFTMLGETAAIATQRSIWTDHRIPSA